MKLKKIAFHLGYFLSCLGILFSVNSYIATENHNRSEVAAAFTNKGTRIDLSFENEKDGYVFSESNISSLEYNADSYLLNNSMFYSESYVSEKQNPFIGDTNVKVLVYEKNVDNYFGVELLKGNYPTDDMVMVSKEFAETYNINELPTTLSFSKKLNNEITLDEITIGGIFDGKDNQYVNKKDINGNAATKYCIIAKNSKNMQHFSAFSRIFEFLNDDLISNSFMMKFGLATIGGIKSMKAYKSLTSAEENIELTNIILNWYSNIRDEYTLDIHVVLIIILVISLAGFILLNTWFFVTRKYEFDIFLTCLIDMLISLALMILFNGIKIGGKVLLIISHFSSLVLLSEICLIICVILFINILAEAKKNKQKATKYVGDLMKDKNGLVSVIIPTYNGSKYLERAIESALNQTYQNIEIIVVNDGSTDNGETDKIVKKYEGKIKYFKKSNGGVSTALNLGIEKSSGFFINWLSHDDELTPTSIEQRLKVWALSDMNEKVIIGSNVSFINENSEEIKRIAAKSRNLKDVADLIKSTTNGCSLLIPKSAFNHHQFTSNVIYMPDYYMWAELLNDGYTFTNVRRKLVKSRIHSEQITLKHIDLMEKDFEDFFKRNIQCNFNQNKHKELRKIIMILKRRSHLHPFYQKYINLIVENLKETHHYNLWDSFELGINNIISWSIYMARKVMSK